MELTWNPKKLAWGFLGFVGYRENLTPSNLVWGRWRWAATYFIVFSWGGGSLGRGPKLAICGESFEEESKSGFLVITWVNYLSHTFKAKWRKKASKAESSRINGNKGFGWYSPQINNQ